MYLAVWTRPDIMFKVGYISRNLENPSQEDIKSAQKLMKYIDETKVLKLVYSKHEQINDVLNVEIHSDSSWADDKLDRKSTSGFVVLVNGCVTNWRSKKQQTHSTSSTEAEYVGCYHAIQEALWIKNFIENLGLKLKDDKITIYLDNTGAIQLSKNAIHNHRTKHIDIKFHFTRDIVQKGYVEIKYVNTNEMIADGTTKVLTGIKLEKMLKMLNLKS